MSNEQQKTIVALLDDLLFMVKISDGAKRAGFALKVVKSEADLMEQARANPALVIFDLNFHGIDPLGVIAKFKADEDLKKIKLLGYVSHVEGEMKRKALEAGCDVVLPRSAFSRQLGNGEWVVGSA